MATLTCSAAAAGVQPKAVHAGANVAYGKYAVSASLSAGDVIQMVKLPAHAQVVDGRVILELTTANTITVTVGDGNDADRYITSLSASENGVVQFSAQTMGDMSYTATDTVDVTIAAVTSATATGTIQLAVTYILDYPVSK